jgi:hypothetical protein
MVAICAFTTNKRHITDPLNNHLFTTHLTHIVGMQVKLQAQYIYTNINRAKQYAVVCVFGTVTNRTGSSETYFQPVCNINTTNRCGIFFKNIFNFKFLQRARLK